MSQEGEDGVADPAAEFIIISSLFFESEVFFEEGDFGHFPFEVGSVFEEIAFVELIEFIPNFGSAVGHLLILLFGDCGLIFLQLLSCIVDHFGGEFVEDDVLFGSAVLIEFYLSPLGLFGGRLHLLMLLLLV